MQVWGLIVMTIVSFLVAFKLYDWIANALIAYGLIIVFSFSFEWVFITTELLRATHRRRKAWWTGALRTSQSGGISWTTEYEPPPARASRSMPQDGVAAGGHADTDEGAAAAGG